VKFFILVFLIGFFSKAHADIEFFFSSAPTGKGRILNKAKFSNPYTGLSHTAIYLSHACKDSTNIERPNLIRLCGKNDTEKGLVVSFDITLQKELKLFFMALKREEFFYGTYKKEDLPQSLSKEQIEIMDEDLIRKYSYLINHNLYKNQIKNLKMAPHLADNLMEGLLQRGISKENLEKILADLQIKLRNKEKKTILKVADYIFKKKITRAGLSRRSVSWGLSYYKSIWSVVYPSTRKEEKAVIDYINSQWRHKKANLVSYNCVTPIISITNILFGKKIKRPPLVSLPYPLMKEIVKNTFKRRRNSFMKFYPKLKIEIEKNTYPTPTSFIQDPKMVGFFNHYLGLYTNNINFDLELMKKNNFSRYKKSRRDIYKRRDPIYKKEKELSNLLIYHNDEQILIKTLQRDTLRAYELLMVDFFEP
jgi:hypothetical protein